MQTVAQNFLAFAHTRTERTRQEIVRCLEQLTEEQAWHRGGDHENSVANLLLHLEGNIRQWILHGIDGQPDVRERDDEFTITPTTTLAEARSRFLATLDEASRIFGSIPEERLLDRINPQPNSTWLNHTILEAVFQVVGHLQLHAGQIILLTKQFAGHDLDLSMPRKR